MRSTLVAKLALGCAAIGMSGSLMGLALANYVESGSFHFYREASARQFAAEIRDARPIDFIAEVPPIAARDGALLQRAAFDR